MDDSALRAVVRASLAHEQRLVGTHLPGARVVERDGVVAAVVPTVPESSLSNAAVVQDSEGLRPAVLAELHTAYAAAGVPKGGVGLAPADRDVLATVSAAGLVFD